MLEWLSGVVVRGDGRGRELGFPTANIELNAESSRPADGVYAGWVRLADDVKLYKGAVHVGPRPTFDDVKPMVEVHLIDFPDRDLYGERISFQCVERLRDIERFASAKELTQALWRDCEKTVSRLG